MARREKRTRKGGKGQQRKTSDDFLARNRRKEGVRVLPSGLQVLVLREGTGPAPRDGDVVVVHQRISLVDGKLLADTYHDDTPETFSLREAIPGYREGLLAMRVGERCRFFIPPELAWGRRGAGKRIPPNAVIIIDAALLELQADVP